MAVASAVGGNFMVYFFDLNDYQGEPLQPSDAAGVLTMSAVNADSPRYLSRGENPDEILITTGNKLPQTMQTSEEVLGAEGGQTVV